MESRDHSKNGASLKSLMSRGNYQIKKFLFVLFATLSISAIFTACGDGQLLGRWEQNGDPNSDYYVFSGNSYTYGYPCTHRTGQLYHETRKGTFLVSGNEIELKGHWPEKQPFSRKKKNIIEIGGVTYIKR